MDADENGVYTPELVDDFGTTPVDFDINAHDESEPEIQCAEPPAVQTVEGSLFAVMGEDAQVAKTVLNNLRLAWGRAKSIDEVCKLSLTTMKVLEQRRTLMNLQLGMVKTLSGGNSGGYGAYDA